MIGIIAVGGIAALVHIGLGQIVLRFLLRQQTPSLSIAFWLGWAMSIAFLQIWHLGMPVAWSASLVLVVLSGVGLWQLRGIRGRVPNVVWLLVGALTLLAIANSGIEAPLLDDNGLYHFQSIRWAETYPIVAGLGNLHGRLAFNSSYFLYIAWLNHIIPNIEGFRVANGLMTIVLLWELFGAVSRGSIEKQGIGGRLAAGLLIFAILFTAFDPLAHYLASPTTDYVVFLLTLKIGWTFFQVLESSRPHTILALLLITLSTGLITIKLSGAVFAAALMVLVGAVMLRHYKRHQHALLYFWGSTAFIIILLMVPWLYRNVVLSGYLVYPGTTLPFPVAWRIPTAQAIEDTRWVQAWARRPEVGVHWSEVLRDWTWLEGWQVNFWRTRGIRLSIVLAGLAWGVGLGKGLLSRRGLSIQLLGAIPALVALLLWFVSAPDPRFALAYFWLLAMGGCIVAIESLPTLQSFLGKLLSYRAAGWGVAIAIVALLLFARGLQWNTETAPIPQAGVDMYSTESGVPLHIPQNGSELCWDAPLPCTPYPRPTLRLRAPHDLSSGFLQN